MMDRARWIISRLFSCFVSSDAFDAAREKFALPLEICGVNADVNERIAIKIAVVTFIFLL